MKDTRGTMMTLTIASFQPDYSEIQFAQLCADNQSFPLFATSPHPEHNFELHELITSNAGIMEFINEIFNEKSDESSHVLVTKIQKHIEQEFLFFSQFFTQVMIPKLQTIKRAVALESATLKEIAGTLHAYLQLFSYSSLVQIEESLCNKIHKDILCPLSAEKPQKSAINTHNMKLVLNLVTDLNQKVSQLVSLINNRINDYQRSKLLTSKKIAILTYNHYFNVMSLTEQAEEKNIFCPMDYANFKLPITKAFSEIHQEYQQWDKLIDEDFSLFELLGAVYQIRHPNVIIKNKKTLQSYSNPVAAMQGSLNQSDIKIPNSKIDWLFQTVSLLKYLTEVNPNSLVLEGFAGEEKAIILLENLRTAEKNILLYFCAHQLSYILQQPSYLSKTEKMLLRIKLFNTIYPSLDKKMQQFLVPYMAVNSAIMLQGYISDANFKKEACPVWLYPETYELLLSKPIVDCIYSEEFYKKGILKSIWDTSLNSAARLYIIRMLNLINSEVNKFLNANVSIEEKYLASQRIISGLLVYYRLSEKAAFIKKPIKKEFATKVDSDLNRLLSGFMYFKDKNPIENIKSLSGYFYVTQPNHHLLENLTKLMQEKRFPFNKETKEKIVILHEYFKQIHDEFYKNVEPVLNLSLPTPAEESNQKRKKNRRNKSNQNTETTTSVVEKSNASVPEAVNASNKNNPDDNKSETIEKPKKKKNTASAKPKASWKSTLFSGLSLPTKPLPKSKSMTSLAPKDDMLIPSTKPLEKPKQHVGEILVHLIFYGDIGSYMKSENYDSNELGAHFLMQGEKIFFWHDDLKIESMLTNCDRARFHSALVEKNTQQYGKKEVDFLQRFPLSSLYLSKAELMLILQQIKKPMYLRTHSNFSLLKNTAHETQQPKNSNSYNKEASKRKLKKYVSFCDLKSQHSPEKKDHSLSHPRAANFQEEMLRKNKGSNNIIEYEEKDKKVKPPKPITRSKSVYLLGEAMPFCLPSIFKPCSKEPIPKDSLRVEQQVGTLREDYAGHTYEWKIFAVTVPYATNLPPVLEFERTVDSKSDPKRYEILFETLPNPEWVLDELGVPALKLENRAYLRVVGTGHEASRCQSLDQSSKLVQGTLWFYATHHHMYLARDKGIYLPCWDDTESVIMAPNLFAGHL